MKKIFKFKLEITDEQILSLPLNSRILSVAEQFGDMVLYAVVDTSEDLKEDYKIIIHGTGHPANDIDNCTFLGTVKMEDGQLMFHVFYKANS